MRVVRSPQAIQKICLGLKKKGQTIAVVPTMGFLHEGHLTLLNKARKLADVVILTLFVNPTQFNPKEDLSRYPRDVRGDLAKAKKCGVDFVFAPAPKAMYPDGYETYIEMGALTQNLCGASRPGHFRGVATIVAKLFNLTQPDSAFFGLKDFQQFAVLKKMVADLHFPIRMVGVATVREKYGLAMSSRNTYLTAQQRQAALCLSQSLKWVRSEIKRGQKNLPVLLKGVKSRIAKQGLAQIDYAGFFAADTLQPLKTYQPKKTLLALAVFFGKTRLIDNVVV